MSALIGSFPLHVRALGVGVQGVLNLRISEVEMTCMRYWKLLFDLLGVATGSQQQRPIHDTVLCTLPAASLGVAIGGGCKGQALLSRVNRMRFPYGRVSVYRPASRLRDLSTALCRGNHLLDRWRDHLLALEQRGHQLARLH